MEAAPEPEPVNGYDFSGWNVTGTFEMPDYDVVVKGAWSRHHHVLTYEWGGDVPAEAPQLPEAVVYGYGDAVQALPEVEPVPGYIFDGWDVDLIGFRMPDYNVAIVGMWTANRHTLSFAYDETAPKDATLPEAVVYKYGDVVHAPEAPSVEGFTFMGWNPDEFVMPDEDVTITGTWAINRHTVRYAYDGDVPEDAPVLPEAEEHAYGEMVTAVPAPAMEGYIFSGWNTDGFVMPDEDVTITGTWAEP